MKKALALALVLACLGSILFAQPASSSGSPKLSARIDALGLLFFMFPVSAEYTINDKITVTAQVLYSPNIMWVSNISVLDIVAGGRFYFGSLLPESLPALVRGSAPSGPFAGPRLGFVTETWKYSSAYKGTYTSAGLGAELGYKYFLKGDRGFYAEGVAGYMYYFPASWKWKLNGESYEWSDSGDPTWDPTRLTYGVTVGYAF